MGSSEVILVGVDGSADSKFALEYAAREALQRGASLRVVSVFESSGIFGARYGLPIPISDEQIAAKVGQETTALVAEVLDGLPERPPAQVVARAGFPGHQLAAESATADLLVVGHRGLNAIAATLLGSVSLHCVMHAQCPVTVVRPTAKHSAEQPAAAAVSTPT